MKPGQGRLILDSTFRIAAPESLHAAARRALVRLTRQTGIPLRAEVSDNSPTLVIEAHAPGAVELGVDESYTLRVTAQQARLTAPTTIGALRGLETFLQLVTQDAHAFHVPAVTIADRPRFPWRGLLIDVCRHWMPVEAIERNLDAMAAVKLNVLHWHLTEDQGFRVESKVYPRLHQMGSDGLFYSQDQIRHIVRYAAERGIRVVPEFDMPGHATSWLVGHPELASGPGPYQIERKWGIFDPTLDPTREEVYQFLDRFLGEMAALFPDQYLHIGGDEVSGVEWKKNQRIQAFIQEKGLTDNHGLQAYFNRRIQEILRQHGKTMVGWDEIFHPDLPRDIVVQSWRGQKSLAEGARQGYRGILSYGYYLDHLRPAAQHYSVDPHGDAAAELTADQQARILGGEACMWNEYVTAEMLDSRIWPRAAVIAERLWSPPAVTEVDSMYRRMFAVRRLLDTVGVDHLASYPRMLRRLAGDGPIEHLQVLADAVRPLGIGHRARNRSYTSQTPMNRLVDAARAESETLWAFTQAVTRFLKAPVEDDQQEVRRRLAQWRDNHARLRPLLESRYLLSETIPVSLDLSLLGATGLEAMDFLEKRRPPSAQWMQEKRAQLSRADEPRAEVSLAAAQPVRMLVEAAAGKPLPAIKKSRPKPRKR